MADRQASPTARRKPRWVAPTGSMMMAVTATAITRKTIAEFKAKRPPRSGGRFIRVPQNSDYDHPGADIDAAVEIDHVLVAHADAAGRDVGADGPGLVGAVNAVKR